MSELATYISGNSVKIRFDAPALSGEISASYRIYDQHGRDLSGNIPVEVFADDEFVDIVIDDTYNTLSGFERKALRIVQLEMTDEGDDRSIQERRYAVIASSDLFVPSEALITLAEAELLLLDVPNVTAFAEATPVEKRKAIIEASRRICGLLFNPEKVFGRDSAFADFPAASRSLDLESMSPIDYRMLPPKFLEDLAVAVVYEADDVLGGDPIDAARRSGLVAERVGESSVTYRQGIPTQEQAGSRAFRVLGRYTTRSYRLGRC